MADVVDTNLLAAILRDIRKEQNDQRTLLLGAVEYLRKMEQRLDARIVAVRDDLELVIRSEIMGRLGNFEARIEERLAELEKRE